MKTLPRKITNYLLLFFGVMAIHTLFAGGTIQWQNTIGGRNMEKLNAIQQTFDGGYILGASSKSDSFLCDKTVGNRGVYDYWVLKLNAVGDIVWQNTIGGVSDDLLEDIQQTSDSGYIVGGTSYSNISADKAENSQGANDYWVLKLDATGNIEWQNTFGGDLEDELKSVQQTFDGGYIIGGSSRSNVSGDKTQGVYGLYNRFDYWIVKLNASGNIEWQKTIGGSDYDYLSTVRQTRDSGYIVAGSSASDISGDKTENKMGSQDGWIIKLGKTGNIQWQNTIGTPNVDVLSSVRQTRDNGYIVGITTNADIDGDKTGACKDYRGSCFKDYWILKLDINGNIQWQNTIGGQFDDVLMVVEQTSDNGYIMGGTSYSDSSHDHSEDNRGTYDYWVVKTDATGNVQWEDNLGGRFGDFFVGIRETADKGYIIGGHSDSDNSGDKTEGSCSEDDLWVIKLSPPEIVTSISSDSRAPEYVKVYPNPFFNAATFEFSGNSTADRFLLYDVNGEILFTDEIRQNQSYLLQRNALPAGMYFYSIQDKNDIEISRGKLIIQ